MLQWIIKIQQEDINDEKNVLKILFLKKAHDHIKFMLYFSKVLWNWSRKYSVSAKLPAMLASRQKNWSFRNGLHLEESLSDTGICFLLFS